SAAPPRAGWAWRIPGAAGGRRRTEFVSLSLSEATEPVILSAARREGSALRRLGGLHRQRLVELDRDRRTLRDHHVYVSRRARRGRAGGSPRRAPDHGTFRILPEQLADERPGHRPAGDLRGVRLRHAATLHHGV